jgi:hypothetical protein
MVRAGAPSTTLVVAGFKVVDGGPSAAMTMMPDQAVSASGRRYDTDVQRSLFAVIASEAKQSPSRYPVLCSKRHQTTIVGTFQVSR